MSSWADRFNDGGALLKWKLEHVAHAFSNIVVLSSCVHRILCTTIESVVKVFFASYSCVDLAPQILGQREFRTATTPTGSHPERQFVALRVNARFFTWGVASHPKNPKGSLWLSAKITLVKCTHEERFALPLKPLFYPFGEMASLHQQGSPIWAVRTFEHPSSVLLRSQGALFPNSIRFSATAILATRPAVAAVNAAGGAQTLTGESYPARVEQKDQHITISHTLQLHLTD